jgi:ribonuclease HI
LGKQKFYAVRIGRTPGIYQTWNQTKEQVEGFPGADYKSFDSYEKAEEYLLMKKDNTFEEENLMVINEKIMEIIRNLEEHHVLAFVDGSYSPDANGREKYAFGVVLITNDAELNLYKAYLNNEYMESRQVAGEVEGVKQAILWAITNNKKEITIFYDYVGIEKWATKEWKANKKVAVDYANFIDEKTRQIKISFKHVKAHSGIIYNERAHELSKFALLAHGYKTYDDGSIYFIGFDSKDWMNIIYEAAKDIEESESGMKIEVEEEQHTDYLRIIRVRLAKYSLTINCYRGRKSYVQGKQSPLFQRIISFAVESLPKRDDVIEVLNRYHALTIKEEEVYNEFAKILPNFPITFSDTKLFNTLLSAVYNTMLVGYMPDYTCLVTPIFRVTEYYLHRILHDKLEKETYKNNRNYFGYFSKDNGKYSYNSERKDLNNNQISLLNDFYNFYCQVRNQYSHWMKDSFDTPVITNINDAREYLLEGLQLVDNYYRIF